MNVSKANKNQHVPVTKRFWVYMLASQRNGTL